MESPYFLKKLKADFSQRQRSNARYSMRAYARDLGMPASTLSQVLLGNRPLPLKNAPRVVEKIRLTAKERTLFNDSLGKKHVLLDDIRVRKNDDRFLLDETYFQIIAEWEHYAALMLFDCDGFQGTETAIQSELGLTSLRAGVVVNNLLESGLLARGEKKRLLRTHSRFRTTEDTASQALRASHREALQIGERKLDEVSLELRDFSSMMLAIDPHRIPEAKTILREFREKLAELMRGGKRSTVYQLGIQFYPLTPVRK